MLFDAPDGILTGAGRHLFEIYGI